jgi:hypothetical protein
MKSFTTTKRTKGITTITDDNGQYLYQVWNTEHIYGEVDSVETFIAQNQPVKSSENLLNAINRAYKENGSVAYNCGNGNQTFNFSEL